MYTKILVPLDGSELSECVLPYVDWFIKVSDVDELTLLRIVEHLHITGGLEAQVPPDEREHLEKDAVKLAQEYLDEIAARFKVKKLRVNTKVLIGRRARTIADYVKRSRADLIIMATHGASGLHRLVRGSVADRVFRAARVPVFLVRPEDRPPDK
jgi:nucleotide-binding universal stress UspA family protein